MERYPNLNPSPYQLPPIPQRNFDDKYAYGIPPVPPIPQRNFDDKYAYGIPPVPSAPLATSFIPPNPIRMPLAPPTSFIPPNPIRMPLAPPTVYTPLLSQNNLIYDKEKNDCHETPCCTTTCHVKKYRVRSGCHQQSGCYFDKHNDDSHLHCCSIL